MTDADSPFLPNGAVIASDKGGAGKSRLAAELAAAAADAGWRVLAVDLDHQHGLGGCLGYHARGLSDEGRGLHDAVLDGEPLKIVHDVCGRSGLDVIPAGIWTRRLKNNLVRGDDAAKDLGSLMAEVAGEYDLVLFDSPPSADDPLFLEALASAAFVMGATKLDPNDLDGVRRLREQVDRVHRKGWNSRLELLGVAVVGWPRERNNDLTRYRQFARRVERDCGVRPFSTPICEAGVAIADMIERGMTSGEYARAIEGLLEQGGYSRTLEKHGFKLSVAGRRASSGRPAEGRVVGGVELGGGLASDCFELAQEILGRIRLRMDATAGRDGAADEAPAAAGAAASEDVVLVPPSPAASTPSWDALIEESAL
jgi:chromosome partitioning protein